MSKINILDQSVFNKIAAGEVVERPASVVKELLDNSIDAGAKNITISIADGGISNITIKDDGSGIEPDDFDKVFVSHATSKVKTEKDLEAIGTLGFRGEALASIASISKVTLTSKVDGETFARTCDVVGGEQTETTEVGGDNGTTISVSDIFFNVPARAKFLKKPKTEAAEITNLVERYILCHPEIRFKYVIDEKEVYHSTGTNLFDAIYVVYGKSAIDGIIKVDEVNLNSGIKVCGYISLPTFSKPNRTYQTLCINGRYVSSQLVSTCVYNAYEHYLMKGQFPFYVLNLEIPLERLDVNVHPNKMEVRFNNSNEIYGNVYNAVSTALYNCDKITTPNNFVASFKEVKSGSSFSMASIESENTQKLDTPRVVEVGEDKVLSDNQNSQHLNENSDNVDENLQKPAKNSSVFNFGGSFSNNNISQSQASLNEPSSPILSKILADRIKEQNDVNSFENLNNQNVSTVPGMEQTMLVAENSPEKSKTQEFFETSDIKFVGQIFKLYLIVEKQDKVYIIDEHAGHERLLFDRFVKEVDSRVVTKQNLLSPYMIDVNRQEFAFLDENLDKLQKLGFDIEQFGEKTFAVNSIPAVLTDLDIKSFFDTILADLTTMKSLKQSDLILNRLMQHSCKCAVRAGKILSSGEVNALIEQMKEEKMQLQCPHGRPVVVELTKTEVEKWFKRIV